MTRIKLKKPLLMALMMTLATPMLSGCIAAVATGAAVGALSVMDRRTLGTQTEDEGIEWKILGNTSKYGDKVHLNQTSFNRKVLLSGEVPDEATKEEIGRMAASVTNVQHVWNELNVAQPSSLQNRGNDSFITSKVKGRFVDGGKFRANLVKVVTEAGTVFLMGIVTRQEADSAIEIARTTAGVKKVVTLMEIISPERARQVDNTPPEARDEKPASP